MALGYAIDPVENVKRDAESSVEHVEFCVEAAETADYFGVIGDPLPTVGWTDFEFRLVLPQVADQPFDPRSLRLRKLLVARPELGDNAANDSTSTTPAR